MVKRADVTGMRRMRCASMRINCRRDSIVVPYNADRGFADTPKTRGFSPIIAAAKNLGT